MFWESVAGGLRVLAHWQAWAAALLFGLLLVIPMIGVGLVSTKSFGAGCAGMFVLPVFQVFATVVVMGSLLPIILGLSDSASWGLPWYLATVEPWWMLRTVLVLTAAAFLSGFAPIVGGLVTFTNLVLGGLAIATLVRILPSVIPDLAWPDLDLIPSFWTVIGFVVVGGIATTLSIFGVAAIATLRRRLWSSSHGHDEPSAGPVVGVLFGFLGLIPAFMYGAWLGLQLKSR